MSDASPAVVDALVVGRRYLVTFVGTAAADEHPGAVQFRTTDGWHPIIGKDSIVSVEANVYVPPARPGGSPVSVSDITPADLQPGMHVEIVQRPWRGVVTAPLMDGVFTADRDDAPDAAWVATSWSADVIGSIRLLPGPLPTEPGATFWGCLTGCDPIWWFTTRGRVDEDVDYVTVYIGQDGTDVHQDDVVAVGLVRLPDPQVAL